MQGQFDPLKPNMPKERYCFCCCLVKQRTLCVTNVWGNTEILPRTIRSFIPKTFVNVSPFSKDDRTVANDFNRLFTSVGKVTVGKVYSLANECNFDLWAPAFHPRILPATEQFNFMHVRGS